MAIYGTLGNKAAAFKLYSKESLSNPDSDNNRGEGFSTYNTALKLNTINVRISSTPDPYTKVWYIRLSKRPKWVLFFHIEVSPSLYLAYIQDLT